MAKFKAKFQLVLTFDEYDYDELPLNGDEVLPVQTINDAFFKLYRQNHKILDIPISITAKMVDITSVDDNDS